MEPRTRPPSQTAPARPSESVTFAARLADRIRVGAQKLAGEYRGTSRFFKMRFGIATAWAVLSAATLWGACPSSGPTNALGADVQVSGDSLLGAQILVRNESGRIWEDVVLTLDDGWRYTHPTMRPHDLVVLSMDQFRRGDEAPPPDYKPRRLRIECAQGAGRFDLR
jgi:hypothetical protein